MRFTQGTRQHERLNHQEHKDFVLIEMPDLKLVLGGTA